MALQTPKQIIILGSTGSIGQQAIDVYDYLPTNTLTINGLSANSNWQLLAGQARKVRPMAVCIGDASYAGNLRKELSGLDIKIYAGADGLLELIANTPAQMALVALVGAAGMVPTLAALDAGMHIALANKEALVLGGNLVMERAKLMGLRILPVDSEHSAIYQCLIGEKHNHIEKVILTASGGPFRGYDLKQLEKVTPQQALKHPNWSMGNKVTIDSASLMNKGLEAIEAKWLFDLPADKIDVVIHPQSVVHSMVQFTDGSIKAQMGPPNMRLPIQYALCYPDRPANHLPRQAFDPTLELNFYPPNLDAFANLRLALDALKQGGNRACVLNAANEIAVENFLKSKISFNEMPQLVDAVLKRIANSPLLNVAQCLDTDLSARLIANEIVGSAIQV